MASTVTVDLKDGCFVNFTIAGTHVELLFSGLGTPQPQLAITSTKKVSALRVMQDLLNQAAKPKPAIAGDISDTTRSKRA